MFYVDISKFYHKKGMERVEIHCIDTSICTLGKLHEGDALM